HAAIAIQNAQLYEAVRRSKDELEQRVIERTAELEAERQRLQTILDAAGEGIYITDAEREIRYVNPALGRITGYEPDELIGQSPRIWRSGYTEASVLDELTHSMKRGLAWRGELVNRRKDGTLYDVALTVSPLRDASGRLIGFVCIQRDITRLKELERLKDQFVSRIGHELRTPVANIKLYLELLERGRPEKHGQYLLTLLHETERLRNLVEGFLEISQFDTGAIQVRLSPVDVNQLARELIGTQRAVAVERGLELSAELAPDMPPARADRALIAQALSRLLDNALKYTAVGGRVAVVTTVQRQADLDWVTVAVRDTGPGISADEIPHLFERFYRGEVTRDFATPGTGLGLAICKEIVDRLGGRITVDSQPNQGATFTVWLKPVSG
ncbi:MAG TPA: ATP-binding protein, partial [Anaerolineae bacterium]